MDNDKQGNGGFILGFAVGAIVGGSLAILIAQRARDSMGKAREAGNIAADATEDLRGKVNDVTTQWQASATDIYERGRQVVEEARANLNQVVDETKSNFNSSVDEGLASADRLRQEFQNRTEELVERAWISKLASTRDGATSTSSNLAAKSTCTRRRRCADAIGELIDRGIYNLVINLEHVRYIDSTGLGVLIGGLKRVREHGGWVNLVCTNPQIRKIFDVAGLVKIFGIFEDEDAAMKALV